MEKSFQNTGIIPTIAEVRTINQKKEQEQEPSNLDNSNYWRKNNRKNTNSRYTQFVSVRVSTTFPPVYKTKCIKHKSN